MNVKEASTTILLLNNNNAPERTINLCSRSTMVEIPYVPYPSLWVSDLGHHHPSPRWPTSHLYTISPSPDPSSIATHAECPPSIAPMARTLRRIVCRG